METKSRFILLKHQAKKAGLHFDLRFKMPGKKDWDSYMIKKGIPTGSEKRMVVRTTIHSEDEALFTGEIKSGYGSGILSKLDSGSADILRYKPDKHIVIRFHGSKLQGVYHFINLSRLEKGNVNQYYFFRGRSLK